MEKKMLLIVCAVLFSVTILTSVTPAASVDDEKYMWTITVRCTGAGSTSITKHCGTKPEAISAAKNEIKKKQRGCGKPEIISAEKGEKCN